MAVRATEHYSITVEDVGSICSFSALKDDQNKYCGYYGNLKKSSLPS
jgi:hypothetical protein